VNSAVNHQTKPIREGHLKKLVRVGALLCVMLTVGCVAAGSNTTGSSENPDLELVRALQQRTAWSASGALGLWTEPSATVSQQNITASVQWAERGDTLGVTLRGPLGIGEMVLQADGAGASLKRGKSTVLGDNPDILVQQALGLAVPVPFSELSKWIRGLPGRANSVKYDGAGRLQSLSYTDNSGTRWQAEISRYSDVDTLQVPQIITAKGGPYNIRLVLKRWQFDPLNSDVKPAMNDSGGRLRIPQRSS